MTKNSPLVDPFDPTPSRREKSTTTAEPASNGQVATYLSADYRSNFAFKVTLPDGATLPADLAKARGYRLVQCCGTARTLNGDPSKCIMRSGLILDTAEAVAGGFRVETAEQLTAALEKAEANAADPILSTRQPKAELERLRAEHYAHAVRSLPEARGRRRSVEKIIAAHTARSMPVERAAVFLRNLPKEGASVPVAKPAGPSLLDRVEAAHADARRRADAGDRPAKERATSLRYALDMHERGTAITRALEIVLIDPATL